jgi:hypothetical protein
MSPQNLRLRQFFAMRALTDGAAIFRCPDGPTSLFHVRRSVFLFMDVFGMTAHAAESARGHGLNIGRAKLQLIEDAISVYHVNCDYEATK